MGNQPKKLSDFYDQNMPAVFEEAKKLVPHFQEILTKHGQDGLVQYVYDYVDEILKRGGLHEIATCGKTGACSFCCHSTILMSRFEKEYIRKIVKLNGIKPNKERNKLQNNKPEAELKWVDRACPFLSSTDGKGNCSIYEIRPLVCRTHNSLEDPNKCMKEDDPTVNISEGRIIQAEACLIALNLLSGNGMEFPDLVPIHKVMFKN